MSLLGIDVGTTNCKAVAFSEDGAVLASASAEYPLVQPRPGWIELDPDVVWRALARCIRQAAAATARDPIRALAVAAQGEAATPVSADGAALANSIVTFDTRTVAQAEWWERTLGRQALFARTGMPLHGMYTLNKLQWLREHRPALVARTNTFLLYGDLVLRRLGLPPVIDSSMASRTMALNVATGDWDDDLLRRAGFDRSQFAPVAASGTVVGEVPAAVAADLGLPKGVLAVAGAHDQPAGALGAGVVRPGLAMYAIGTVECVTPAFDRPVLAPAMLDANLCCEPHAAAGLWVTLAFNFSGGSLLRWYRDTLCPEETAQAAATGADVYDLITAGMAAAPPELLLLPHFAGSGTPTLDPNALGAVVGLRLGTTRAELTRAVLEGPTYEMALNLEALDRAGVAVRTLRAIGGGARSDRWLQLKADVLGRPVERLALSEATAFGAALLAGQGAGLWPSAAERAAALARTIAVFEPDPATHAIYAERLAVYRDLAAAVAPLAHRLQGAGADSRS